MKWMTRNTSDPGIARSIPRFSGLSDETLNRGPVSVRSRCWWDVKREFTHSVKQGQGRSCK